MPCKSRLLMLLAALAVAAAASATAATVRHTTITEHFSVEDDPDDLAVIWPRELDDAGSTAVHGAFVREDGIIVDEEGYVADPPPDYESPLLYETDDE